MPLTVAQLVARLTADTSGFYRGMAIANASMLRTGGLITRVAAGAGLAVAGMGILSLRAAGNFQQSMNILQAVSGATTDEMSKLNKEAIALGADFKLPNVSAKDAADAMAELAKGGLSVQQVMGATRGTLQLGLAANMGFADSATIVARALSAFSLKGTQATQVADLFTAAANKSTADMGDIALGFQMASAQFAGADQTIQGLTTSLALMANAGVVGSDAGTSLKTMINRLTAPTAKSAELMKKLGISVYDASGNVKQMPDIIGNLNQAMSGMSKEQRNAALYTIFGSDAIRAARIQMNAGEKGWRKMEASITKGGEAQAFAEARTKGFNGALQAFGSAVETLAIQLGTALLPAATAVVRAMSNFIASINPDKIIAFFGAIANVVTTIYDFVSASDALVSIIGGAIAAFITYRTVMFAAATAMRIASAAMFLLDAAMDANPIVLIIAALVGLGAALVIAYQRSETFRNIVNGVFEFLKSAVLTVVNFIRDHWLLILAIFTSGLAPLVALIVQHWSQIKNTTMAIWNAISGFFRKWWPLILIIMTGGAAIVVAQIIKHWRTVFNVTMAIWNSIKGFIQGVVHAIVGVVRSVLSPIVGVVKGIWNAVKGAITAILDAIKSAISAKFSGILDYIRGLAGLFGGIGGQLASALVSGILGGLGGLAGALGDAIAGAAESALGAAKSLLGIGSPSKLFRDEIGHPIADGILDGFIRGAAVLPRSVAHEVTSTVHAAGGALPDAPRSIGATRSSTPGMTYVTNNFVVHGSVLSERELFDKFRTLAAEFARNNSRPAFQQ